MLEYEPARALFNLWRQPTVGEKPCRHLLGEALSRMHGETTLAVAVGQSDFEESAAARDVEGGGSAVTPSCLFQPSPVVRVCMAAFGAAPGDVPTKLADADQLLYRAIAATAPNDGMPSAVRLDRQGIVSAGTSRLQQTCIACSGTPPSRLELTLAHGAHLGPALDASRAPPWVGRSRQGRQNNKTKCRAVWAPALNANAAARPGRIKNAYGRVTIVAQRLNDAGVASPRARTSWHKCLVAPVA